MLALRPENSNVEIIVWKKLNFRLRTQLPTTMRTKFSSKTVNTYISFNANNEIKLTVNNTNASVLPTTIWIDLGQFIVG